MRLVRAAHGTEIVFGRLVDDVVVVLGTESSYPGADALRELIAAGVDLAGDGPRIPLNELQLKAPVGQPEKTLCVGLNYAEHAEEVGEEAATAPLFFNKTPNAIIGDGEPIILPADVTDQLDYEAELVAVIGREVSDIPEESALEAVLGYTVGNDVSARDVQFGDGQWLRGKSMDTFGPIGPWIVTPDESGDPQNLPITCKVNGAVLQDSNTRYMIHSVAALVSYASRFFTLVPGDLIFTGTPSGVGFARNPPVWLKDGDTIEVDIEGIGLLSNRVVLR